MTGTNNNTVWYGSNHEAAGYDQRTQEYALFHFNYEHEFHVRAMLRVAAVSRGHTYHPYVCVRWCGGAVVRVWFCCCSHRSQAIWRRCAKGREELRALVKAPRLTWRYSPFDFFAAPPCDTPGGGHCPLAPAHNNENERGRHATET